jgi:anaerobic ribonucleoside-triphosphate reductase activating protein
MKYLDTKIVFQEVPDEISLAINITGCPCHCEGCHSPYLAEDTGLELTSESMHALIYKNPGITCVAFMGGDAYKNQLIELFKTVKQTYGIKTCWYSGRDMDYSYEGLKWLDFIKTGPFIRERGPLSSPYTNQRYYEVIYDPAIDAIGLKDCTERFLRK